MGPDCWWGVSQDALCRSWRGLHSGGGGGLHGHVGRRASDHAVWSECCVARRRVQSRLWWICHSCGISVPPLDGLMILDPTVVSHVGSGLCTIALHCVLTCSADHRPRAVECPGPDSPRCTG